MIASNHMASCLFERLMVDLDEGRSTCCLQDYEWQQTNKIGQIAFFLVRLLQDLSEKLDIGHKLSSKRFHGKNNSEFSN